MGTNQTITEHQLTRDQPENIEEETEEKDSRDQSEERKRKTREINLLVNEPMTLLVQVNPLNCI